MTDLETAPTDDLLDELSKRFEPFIFIGEPLANREPPSKVLNPHAPPGRLPTVPRHG